jgi:hypothetical protein
MQRVFMLPILTLYEFINYRTQTDVDLAVKLYKCTAWLEVLLKLNYSLWFSVFECDGNLVQTCAKTKLKARKVCSCSHNIVP